MWPCPWNPYPLAESRIDLPGLYGQLFFFKLYWADVVQRRVQSGPLVSDQLWGGFVLGVAPRSEALPGQLLDFQ